MLPDKLIYDFIDMERIAEIEICEENEDLIVLLKFLTCKRREEMETLTQKNENLKQAYDTLVHISQDPAERALAIARDKFLWDQEAKERGAREEGIELGRGEGIEKKKKKGIEIGEKIGIIEAAKKLLSTGMDKKTVCEMLGISESELI
jgi:predicted transposase/invertase (TIGR01784 family)